MTTYMTAIVLRVLAAPVPNGDPAAPPGVADKANTVIGWLKYFGLAACVAGLIIAGMSMAINHRRGMGGAEAASQVGFVAIALVIIGAASAIVGALA